MNLLTTLACLFWAFAWTKASAQDQMVPPQLANVPSYLPAITSVYGDTWVANNSEAVIALENCFTNRMKYQIEPLTVNDKYPLLSSFPLMNRYNPTIVAINYSQFNPETFIPITYNLPFFSDQKQVIRVDGTDYIIVIDPILTKH
ncbi:MULTISPECIES: hypothetical protein [Fluviicola]|uniref:hypothetical protein n=1 Tax=Fluviicola TaxID=332102 RepID=UPI0031381F45